MIPPSDIYGLSSFSTFFYKIELSSSNESNCLTHQKSYIKQCFSNQTKIDPKIGTRATQFVRQQFDLLHRVPTNILPS